MKRLLVAGFLVAGFLGVDIGLLSAAAPATGNGAVIIDSGSTNRPAFRITVDHLGFAELATTSRKTPRQKLPAGTLKRFEADLKAAKPLTSLPHVRCMKSASFGSTLTVVIGGEQTPDLNCGDRGNTAMQNIIRDVNEIVALVHAN